MAETTVLAHIVIDCSPWRPIEEKGVRYVFEVNLSNKGLMIHVVRHIRRAKLARILIRPDAYHPQGLHLEGYSAVYVAAEDLTVFQAIYAKFKGVVLTFDRDAQASFEGEAYLLAD